MDSQSKWACTLLDGWFRASSRCIRKTLVSSECNSDSTRHTSSCRSVVRASELELGGSWDRFSPGAQKIFFDFWSCNCLSFRNIFVSALCCKPSLESFFRKAVISHMWKKFLKLLWVPCAILYETAFHLFF